MAGPLGGPQAPAQQVHSSEAKRSLTTIFRQELTGSTSRDHAGPQQAVNQAHWGAGAPQDAAACNSGAKSWRSGEALAPPLQPPCSLPGAAPSGHTHQTAGPLGSSSPLFPKSSRCACGCPPAKYAPAPVPGTAFWADPGLLTTSRSGAHKVRSFNPVLSRGVLFRKDNSKEKEEWRPHSPSRLQSS